MRTGLVTATVFIAAAAVAGCSETGHSPGAVGRSAARTVSSSAGSAGSGHTRVQPRTGGSVGRAAPMTAVAKPMSWRLPEQVGREVVVSTGGTTAVVAGGLVAGDQSTSTSFRLDVSTGRHTALPDLPIPVHDAWGVSSAGHPVVLGGGNATEQSAIQSLGAADRWTVRGHLPGPRSDLVALSAGHRFLVIGGYDGVAAQKTILGSTDGRHFRALGRLPVAVRYPAVAALGGRVWVLGGENNGHMLDAVQRVDPATGTATVVAHLPHPLGHAMAVPFGSRILLVGGRPSETAVTGAMWWFDPAARSFRRAGRLRHPLADAGVLPLGQRAYLLGGETPALTSRVIELVTH